MRTSPGCLLNNTRKARNHLWKVLWGQKSHVRPHTEPSVMLVFSFRHTSHQTLSRGHTLGPTMPVYHYTTPNQATRAKFPAHKWRTRNCSHIPLRAAAETRFPCLRVGAWAKVGSVWWCWVEEGEWRTDLSIYADGHRVWQPTDQLGIGQWESRKCDKRPLMDRPQWHYKYECLEWAHSLAKVDGNTM